MTALFRHVLLCSAAAPGMLLCGTAQAQDAPYQGDTAQAAIGSGDIVVTARRRAETSLSAPVTITGMSQQVLETRGIRNLDGFARTVPGLIIAEASGATQGGALSLRGISASDSNPFGDQAVAFNVDGVQIARASVRRMSEVDLEQIEVLKGPQALYYGKNSPAGIVVMRTADPKDRLEAGFLSAYEMNAEELRLEGYLSTPITEGFGIRVAGYRTKMRGWVKNMATPSPLYGPHDRDLPGTHEYGGRLTLKYDDGGPFRARLKVAHSVWKSAGPNATAQRVACLYGRSAENPNGIPHYGNALNADGVRVPTMMGGPDNCKADDEIVRADMGTQFGSTVWPAFGDGVPTAKQKQTLAGLELNYDIMETLELSSITGYYKTRYAYIDNLSGTDPAFATQTFVSNTMLNMREVSQEVRLTSSFDGPFNFVTGAYYQDAKMFNSQPSYFNAITPAYAVAPNASTLDGKAWSVFASVSIKPTETIEISGGGRYSHEKKDYAAYCLLTGTGPCPGRIGTGTPITDRHAGDLFDPSLPGGTAVSQRTFKNFSPEGTIAWRPNNRMTLFGSYKTGFLSGGFQTGSGNFALDQSYEPQKVKGFEAGLKALWLDGALRTNLALFTYKITDQQVGFTVGNSNFLRNAASSRTKGVEFDFNWTTPLEGLSLRGGGTYNKARYLSYPGAPCYAGQTPAQGCTINASGGAEQDLSGQVIVRSPKWGTFAGGTFEKDVAPDTTIGFSSDANWSGGYYAEASNKPHSWQKHYLLLDATAFVRKGPFELSFIGRNLTNTYYFQRTIDSIFTGGGTGTNNVVYGDTYGVVSRGRELTVQFRYKM